MVRALTINRVNALYYVPPDTRLRVTRTAT